MRFVFAKLQQSCRALVASLGIMLSRIATAEVPAASVPAGPVDGSEVLNLLVSLVVVVGAILLVGWIYSRMQGGMTRGNGAINVVATRPIGPKERILVVEIADKQLVVGMTSSSVQTLHVFDERVLTGAESSPASGFSDRLKTAMRGIRK